MRYDLLIFIGLASALATLAGGLIAVRLRTRLSLFRAFSCGVVIGVALIELLPEAHALAEGTHSFLTLMVIATGGFCLYLLVDRLIGRGGGGHRGHLDPASLTLHSLMDGLAIGLAFKASPTAGAVIAVSVLAHDLLDGLNTVSLSLAGGAKPRTAMTWLAADALAPSLGLIASLFIVAAPSQLALLLALFAGFFLYIGAHESFSAPAAGQQRPGLGSVFATLAGLGVITAAARLGDVVTLSLAR